MAEIKSILKAKPSKAVITVAPETSVLDAIQLMCNKNISCLIVTRDEKLVGIFTERDYIRKLILQGKQSNSTIAEVMTANPITVNPNTSADDCMRLMSKNHFRHLPVSENGNLIGVISIGDLVQQIIEEKTKTIGYLEQYIQHT